MTNQQGAPEALPDPSPDQLRAIARTARNSSGSASDDCGPLAYVLHGWRAAAIALRAQQAALVEAQQPAPSAAAAQEQHYGPLRDADADWGKKLTVYSPTPQADSQPAPIDMVLHCPKCGLQHIDAAEPELGPSVDGSGDMPLWANPPHRSHLCHGCGHIWRPADVPTNGVAAVKTTGKADSPIAARAPADSVTAPAGGANTKTAELLSTTVGLLMGYREGGARQPYRPGSVIAKTVDEVVEHLRGWPYPEPTPPAQAADSVLEDADPLQGAANWLAEAHGQFCVAVLQGCLMIGYNRAKRLHDAAIAARKQGGA